MLMRPDLRGRAPDVSLILPSLLVGEYPRVADVGWLHAEHRVSAVLSLQHDSDLWDKGISLAELEREYDDRAMEFRRFPVEDYSEADLDLALPHAVRALDEMIASGHTVFLHCNAGYNRAPTVAIAYLCSARAMSLDEAVRAVKQRRACVPYVTLLRKRFEPPRAR